MNISPSARAARWFVISLVWISLLTPWTATGEGAEKITIGELEEVSLLKWGVKYSARIDTGATSSSLDARKIRIKNDGSSPCRVGNLGMILDLRKHAGEDLETQVLFIV